MDTEMKTYRPQPDSVFTVRELISILSKANPDALVIVGKNMNDCEDYIERVVFGVDDPVIGLFTESEDDFA